MRLLRTSRLLLPSVEQVFPVMVILTAAALLAIPAMAQDSSQDSISLSLRSDKVSYSSSDPIAFTVTLENRSLYDITVNKRMAHPGPDLMIDIEDVMGDKLRWLPAAPPRAVTRNDFTVLTSGQKLVLPISGVEIGLFDKLKRDRTYRVKARYENTEDGGRFNHKAWTGSLTSNTIVFEWKG